MIRTTQTPADDSALVLLDDDGVPRAAESRALELCGAATLADLRDVWPTGLPGDRPRAVGIGGKILLLCPARILDDDGRAIPAVRLRAARSAADAVGWLDLRRIGRFVSHDVRGALNALSLHLDLLRAAVETAAPPPRGSLRVARRNLARVEGALRVWLDAARERPDEPVDFDALETAREVRRLARPFSRKRGVRISTVRAAASTRAVRRAHGDREGLRLALLGALVDAVAGAATGRSVRLELTCEENAPVWRLASAGPGAAGRAPREQAGAAEAARAAEVLRSGGSWTREPDGTLSIRLRPAVRRGIG